MREREREGGKFKIINNILMSSKKKNKVIDDSD